MRILGIETACDDTAAAVVEDGTKILSNIVWGQKDVHERFSGVVPELAARRHTEVITLVIQEALDQAGVGFDAIHAVGVNCHHGLLRSLVVGVAAAKGIAFALNLPLVGVHHIEGHIYANLIAHPDMAFPHLCLTVSGGHNLLIEIRNHGDYRLLGRTLDDAAGEAFDKVAKLLGLPFPGGPVIDRLAKDGDPERFLFPRPMLNHDNDDFSFSGLKTAVLNVIGQMPPQDLQENLSDLAAGFQAAVIDVLAAKTLRAAKRSGITTINLAGGVAANSALRDRFRELAETHGLTIHMPEPTLCTDNGAAIAALAFYKLRQGQKAGLDLDARANAPLGAHNIVYRPGAA